MKKTRVVNRSDEKENEQRAEVTQVLHKTYSTHPFTKDYIKRILNRTPYQKKYICYVPKYPIIAPIFKNCSRNGETVFR